MRKMQEKVGNTDGNVLCGLMINTDGYCEYKSTAIMKSCSEKILHYPGNAYIFCTNNLV